MSQSEVAQFRQKQLLEEQSAKLGLHGFRPLARHKQISERATELAELVAQGRHEEAFALWNAML